MLRDQDDRVADFLELYTMHYRRLQLYVMALLPNANDAADVLQETSLVLWQKFDSFELGSNFFAWACKIARLQVLKSFERRKRSAKIFDNELLEVLVSEAQAEYGVHGESLKMLEDCLGKLPESDRVLIRRRYQSGTTVKQIATEVGRSANSLSKSLGRIRRTLLKCVEHSLIIESRE